MGIFNKIKKKEIDYSENKEMAPVVIEEKKEEVNILDKINKEKEVEVKKQTMPIKINIKLRVKDKNLFGDIVELLDEIRKQYPELLKNINIPVDIDLEFQADDIEQFKLVKDFEVYVAENYGLESLKSNSIENLDIA